ncbi:hypothetical protein ACFO26_01675 [Lactococcus nasutitermitis]|uniref:YrhK domain-containing protein n=1 Tax=Lactococcus nasutitermitis TaxID=1652957 RepID=A0ABV9JE02_9LACT|nr:hypothetical protein [Lactococcus nasutitermitis]
MDLREKRKQKIERRLKIYDNKKIVYRDSIIFIVGYLWTLYGFYLYFSTSSLLGLLTIALVGGGTTSDLIRMVRYIKRKHQEY